MNIQFTVTKETGYGKAMSKEVAAADNGPGQMFYRRVLIFNTSSQDHA